MLGRQGGVGCPGGEALPAKLPRGPRLVWQPVAVEPPLDRGAPTAVPHECESAFAIRGHGDDRAAIVRAPGHAVDTDALDRQRGFGMEQLGDHAEHLDTRRGPKDGDARCLSMVGVRPDIGSKRGRRAGRGETGVEIHGT